MLKANLLFGFLLSVIDIIADKQTDNLHFTTDDRQIQGSFHRA